MIKIACAGDNCVDYYDNTGESFPGGNPVNVSVYVKRLGGQSAYLGAVGTDDFGKQMCAALQEKGVDVSHVQILPGKTAFTHVERINGERVFGDYDEGVMAVSDSGRRISTSSMDTICWSPDCGGIRKVNWPTFAPWGSPWPLTGPSARWMRRQDRAAPCERGVFLR